MLHRRPWLALCASVILFLSAFSLATPAWAMGGTLPPLDQPAPDFALASSTGEGQVNLADYRGQWVVAYFYPQDFTSGCTIEAKKFQQDLPEYIARQTQVIGISSDSVESHADFCDSEGLKFPLLADQSGTVSKAYGSWMGARSARHTYIIGPDGTLKATFLGVNPLTHSREVLAKLDELQKVPG
jgi:thioredoxin-dependent peroxiredoxin